MPTQTCDTLLYNIGCLVTMTGDGSASGPLVGRALGGSLGEIRNAAIAIRGGMVADIGPSDKICSHWQPAESGTATDCDGRLVTPGLVDCHTHPVWVESRAHEFELKLAGASYQEIAAAGGGIRNSVRKLCAADDQTISTELRRHLGWLRRHGVMAAECKSGYGLTLEHELRSLRAIRDANGYQGMRLVGTCLAAHVVPPDWSGDADNFVDHVVEQILPAVVREGLATAADVFVEEGAFTESQARRVISAARQLGLSVHVHADQLGPGAGTRLAVELGAASADHLEYVTPELIQRMAETGVAGVLLPGSTFYLRQDVWAPGRALVDAGVVVALSTDFNPGSSPCPNPAFIMSLACLKLGLKPAEALAAFTRNAAVVAGVADSHGSLSVGRPAAAVLWEAAEVREIPYFVGAGMAQPL